jgi:hypothetical protein
MSRKPDRSKPRRDPPAWLKALGHKDLPETVVCNGATYRRVQVFKHDFFAATGLYEQGGRRAVYKVGRTADFFGFPLAWLGRWLCRREARAYERLGGLDGVPAYIGLVGESGFLHEYLPGHVLQRGEQVSDEFFGQLKALLSQVHARDMAYVDLEKRENILVCADGRPGLIDFQVSFYWPVGWGGGWAPARWLLRCLQEGDQYHWMKHWRRHRPDQLTDQQIARSRKKPGHVQVYTMLFRPFQHLRRRTLDRLDAGRVRGV